MATYGQGTGDIVEGLGCTGDEARVFDCPRTSEGTSTVCTHAEDAGVDCSTVCEYTFFFLSII